MGDLLPILYLGAAMRVLDGGLIGLLPFLGLIGLVAGVVLGVWKRASRLLWYLVPIAIVHLHFLILGIAYDVVELAFDESPLGYRVCAYGLSAIMLGIVVAISAWAGLRAQEARQAAACLAIFAVSYAIAGVALVVGFIPPAA